MKLETWKNIQSLNLKNPYAPACDVSKRPMLKLIMIIKKIFLIHFKYIFSDIITL